MHCRINKQTNKIKKKNEVLKSRKKVSKYQISNILTRINLGNRRPAEKVVSYNSLFKLFSTLKIEKLRIFENFRFTET
jgi:hypothetical protein